MYTYKSCNCRVCRHVAPSAKKWHKVYAHRVFRRISRQLVKQGREAPKNFSTGYKA